MSIIEIELEGISRAIIEFTEDTSRSIHAFGSEEFITSFIGRTRKIDDTLDSNLNY
jgi:hypothetical protein